MSTSWPTAVQRFFGAFPASRQDPVWPASRIIDTLADTVEAIQDTLGTAVKGTASSVRARLEGIENGSRITALSIDKVEGDFYWAGDVKSTGHILADGNVQGYDGVRAGPVSIGHPITFTAWVRALTNGSGAATIAHNIPSLQRRVIDSSAWFRGAGGEARNLLPTGYVIDGTNVTITGAPANTRCRIGITYMADVDSDWP